MPEKQDINQNRLYAAISYLWILFLIPIIFKRRSDFAMHHARQGLLLLLAEFFVTLIAWIPFFGIFIFTILGTILAILVLFGIISALDGKYWEMPVLGRYAKKIKI